ncbi:hypothetical protein V8D89_000384 [Ganoderma adspersum]
MFDIVDVPFSEVPDDEQTRFLSKVRDKPRQFWHFDNGVRDQIQNYAVVRPAFEQQHPKALHLFLPEIHEYGPQPSKRSSSDLRLLALGLELPEETFVEQNRFDAEGVTFLMRVHFSSLLKVGSRLLYPTAPVWIVTVRPSHPRSDEDEAKTKNVWMKGRTDGGTISLLWSQPVVALQIMSPDGRWRYVKHVPNGITWGALRASMYGKSALGERKENGVEEEILNGIVIKHYN